MEVAFTDRHGGVSTGTYGTLNLALEGEDDPQAVAENLRRVSAAFSDGGPLYGMRQVHGADVLVVDGPDAGPAAVCDGLVTDQVGVALMVRAADCVPVLLADSERGVIAAAHAGRKGLVAGVVPRTLAALRLRGAVSIRAWLGPHICGLCYEVPDVMRDEVARLVPQAHGETSWGTASIDLGAGVVAQLHADGVEVVLVGPCTRESADLHSFRRDGDGAGRLAGLIRLRP